ncbi:MAG: PA14 domain-containing protein [Patescibacteria group bacterium]
MKLHRLVSLFAGLSLAFTSLVPGGEVALACNQQECSGVDIVTNGSFENPAVQQTANWDIFGPTAFIEGWSAAWRSDVAEIFNNFQRPAPQIELQRGVGGWLAKDGAQLTELDTDWGGPSSSQGGEPASIQLWQDLSTVPGASYEVKFYTSPRPGTGTADNITEAKWGNTVLDTITEDGSANPNTVWAKHIYTATAVATTTRLMFTDLGTANSLGSFLDSVSVSRICEPSQEIPCDFGDQTGWYGEYFNYSSQHPDMELPGSEWMNNYGDPWSVNAPWTTDWYTQPYFRFWQVDSNLNFGDNFFPFDDPAPGIPEEIQNGHEYDFGVHWTSKVAAPSAGEYHYTLTSDDDAWIYLDGALVGDNHGVHPPATITGALAMTGEPQIIDVYFAERHTVQSHMALTFTEEGLTIVPYNRACPEEPQEPPVATLEKTGTYDASQGQITYEINWSITGEGALDNVTITDPLPAGTHFVSADNGGTETGGVVTWDLETKAAGESGTVLFVVSLDAAFATSVVSTDQGTNKNGTPVLAERSHPETTLGAPQSSGGADSAGIPVDEWFYSLGFPTETSTASIILRFDHPIINGVGDDLMVYEVTYGTAYPMEKAQVEVSKDMTVWEVAGTVERDGSVGLPDDMPLANYVRLTDVSDKKLFEGAADGYDVDATLALHPGICELNNTADFVGEFNPNQGGMVPVVASAEVLLTINEDACVPTVRIDKTGEYNETTGEILYTINWGVGGKGTLYDVTVTDQVPTGTTYVEDSASDPDNGGPLSPGSETGGEVSWYLGAQAAGNSGILTFAVTVDSTEAWADHVVSYHQGKRWNGTPVLAERSHPEKALGEAERDDTVNFFSLGFGEIEKDIQYGEIVLGFDNYILNGPGADIEVVETSYGSPSDSAYPETVECFVSQDGTNWFSLGQGIQDEMFSFESGSTILPWAKYVKLVDRSDKSKFGNSTTTDGYDVDGVRAIYPGADECSIDNTVIISGETSPNEIWQVFLDNIEAEAVATTAINPRACTGTITGYKFNDRNGNGYWGDQEEGLPEWTIKAVVPAPVATVEVPATAVDGIDSISLPAGKYLFQVSGDWQGAAGEQNRVDAEYVTHDTWATWKDGTFDYEGGGVDQGDLLINDSFFDWGPYDLKHMYYLNYELAEAGVINFSVFDGNAITHEKVPGWYNDNVGNLWVNIYQVVDETVTGPDGGYNLTIPSTYPHVWVFEIPKRGWQQTAPGSIYYDVDLSTDKTQSGLNFGNQGLVGAVSGVKFNDKDGDGVKDEGDNGLGKWTIYASKLIQTVAVEARNSISTSPVFWTAPLTAGKEYILRVSGTYDANDGITADAKYSFRVPNSTEWTDIVKNYESYGSTLLDLFVDDADPNWGVYNPHNVYWYTITGTGDPVKLQIYEIYAQNDSGALTVGIYEVIDKQVTDDTGYYQFDLSGAYGNVMISEQTQDGWLETLPAPDGYYLVSAYGTHINKDFGNYQLEQEPGPGGDPEPELGSITGMKFNDHNGNGIKDDENDEPLSGWTIYLDLDDSVSLNGAEPSIVTLGDGSYSFAGLSSGNYVVREVPQDGWGQTLPNLSYGYAYGLIITDAGEDHININFGNKKGQVGTEGSTGGGTGGGGYYTPPTEPTGESSDEEEGVGGGDVAGDEDVNTPPPANPTFGSGGRQLALGTGTAGDEGNLEQQGDILGEQDEDNQPEDSQGGASGWQIFGIISISLLLLLLIIYGIYKWANRKGKATPGGM